MHEPSLTRGVSFFSLGFGLAELLAPRAVARLVGLNPRHDNFIRLVGLRDISSGLGIMRTKSAACHWSRVAGDAIDLALLSATQRSPQNNHRRLNLTLAAVAGVAVRDLIAACSATRSPGLSTRAQHRRAIDDEDFQLPLGLHRDPDDFAAVEPDFGESVRPAGAPDFPQSAP